MDKEDIIQSLQDTISNFEQDTQVEKIGRVISVGDGIAEIVGLSSVVSSEMLEFVSSGKSQKEKMKLMEDKWLANRSFIK